MFQQKVSCWETLALLHFLPFPLIIPPQDRGGEARGEGEMTFSFVLLRAPYYHLSRETLSFSSLFMSFFSLLLSHNRSFILALSFHVPCVSRPLPPSFFLFCSIIAWLINYKEISNSEKRSWHFNLLREKNLSHILNHQQQVFTSVLSCRRILSPVM